MHDIGPDPILILSGSQHLRRTIDLALRLGRRRTAHHADLAEALELLRSGKLRASAAVLDAFLPDPATLALLSETVARPPIPLVVLAGYDVAEGLSAPRSPAVTVLVPPFTMDSLTGALREISGTGPWCLVP